MVLQVVIFIACVTLPPSCPFP